MAAVPLMTREQMREALHIIRDGWNERKLRERIEKEAEDLATAMRARVHSRHGDLRGSIRVKKSKSPLVFLVTAGGRATTTPGGYDYSLATEFGTHKERARPFFWNTYRARARGIRTRIEAEVMNAVAELNQTNVVIQTNPMGGGGAQSVGASIGHLLGDF